MSSATSLQRALTAYKRQLERSGETSEGIEKAIARWAKEGVTFWRSSPKLLLPYQARWIDDSSAIKVCEKSRRVGISWADAADSVLKAAVLGGQNVYYIGYNAEMAETYIQDAASWAKHFNVYSSAVQQVFFKDGDEDGSILAFRIRFASGRQLVALSSRPKNLRSKKGHIKVDEAAFHEDLDELLKAAIAIKMWGGTISIWSTHNGVTNPFNQMIEKIRDEKLSYSLHRITLDDAIADGLYRRICLVTGIKCTVEGQEEWESDLRSDYGPAGAEELDVIPFAGGAGSVYSKHWFNEIPLDRVPYQQLTCRYWDLAATAKQLAKKHHYYTAGTKIGRLGDRYTVLHSYWEQCGPSEIEGLIRRTAIVDGRESTIIGIELEGGSEASIWAERFSNELRRDGFNVEFRRPCGDKVARAIGFATIAQNNKVDVVHSDVWTKEYLESLHAFDGSPQPKINDIADSTSGAYALLLERGLPASIVQPGYGDLSESRVFL
jgi:predicted phage terminase large subunit-like protein